MLLIVSFLGMEKIELLLLVLKSPNIFMFYPLPFLKDILLTLWPRTAFALFVCLKNVLAYELPQLKRLYLLD